MTAIMGIINLTPDSFSGDGLANHYEAVLTHIDAMVREGTAIIDIGAQSTRPGARILSHEEEWSRLQSLLEALKPHMQDLRISVDTYHANTAQKALALGVRLINDVSGSHDAQFIENVVRYNAQLVVMHSLSVPADANQLLAPDADAVQVVDDWMAATITRLEKNGLARKNIIIDPGIGFGKSKEQSFALIRNAAHFKRHGVPLLFGHSRKSFLSLFSSKPAAERDPETLAVSYFLAEQGVDYLRVHDVAGHMAMLRMRAAL